MYSTNYATIPSSLHIYSVRFRLFAHRRDLHSLNDRSSVLSLAVFFVLLCLFGKMLIQFRASKHKQGDTAGQKQGGSHAFNDTKGYQCAAIGRMDRDRVIVVIVVVRVVAKTRRRKVKNCPRSGKNCSHNGKRSTRENTTPACRKRCVF